MEELLADPNESGLIVTTLAEELAALETNEKLAALDEAQSCQVASVVVNGLLPALDADEPSEAGPLRDAAILHTQLFEGQQKWLKTLPEAVDLPYLFGMLTPTEVAARLADELP